MGKAQMQVAVRGVVYPDARAAAKALKVAVSSVYCAVIRGNPDRLGLGPDYRRRRTRGGLPPKPVTVAGQNFASMADLARAIGRDPRCVRKSLQGGAAARERIVRAVIAMVADRENKAMRAAMRAHPEDRAG